MSIFCYRDVTLFSKAYASPPEASRIFPLLCSHLLQICPEKFATGCVTWGSQETGSLILGKTLWTSLYIIATSFSSCCSFLSLVTSQVKLHLSTISHFRVIPKRDWIVALQEHSLSTLTLYIASLRRRSLFRQPYHAFQLPPQFLLWVNFQQASFYLGSSELSPVSIKG